MKNPVAKYMNKFNKAATHVDKKKKERKEPTLEDFIEMKKAFDAANVETEGRYVVFESEEHYNEACKVILGDSYEGKQPED